MYFSLWVITVLDPCSHLFHGLIPLVVIFQPFQSTMEAWTIPVLCKDLLWFFFCFRVAFLFFSYCILIFLGMTPASHRVDKGNCSVRVGGRLFGAISPFLVPESIWSTNICISICQGCKIKITCKYSEREDPPSFQAWYYIKEGKFSSTIWLWIS